MFHGWKVALCHSISSWERDCCLQVVCLKSAAEVGQWVFPLSSSGVKSYPHPNHQKFYCCFQRSQNFALNHLIWQQQGIPAITGVTCQPNACLLRGGLRIQLLHVFIFNPRYGRGRETQALLLIRSLTSSETTGGEICLDNAGSVKVKHNPRDKNLMQQTDLALGL